jgi:hypothetical protein
LGLVLIVPTALIITLFYAFESLDLLAKFHMIAVLWFGLLGAYMSRMIAFQRVLTTVDYDTLETDFSVWSTAVRLIVGTLGALLMYFLIVGDLVGGQLFPQWPSEGFIAVMSVQKTATGVAATVVPVLEVVSKEFAQLLIWSTIAGFSERLLPDRFAALEAAAAQKK